jgi:hypothetical protein
MTVPPFNQEEYHKAIIHGLSFIFGAIHFVRRETLKEKIIRKIKELRE